MGMFAPLVSVTQRRGWQQRADHAAAGCSADVGDGGGYLSNDEDGVEDYVEPEPQPEPQLQLQPQPQPQSESGR